MIWRFEMKDQLQELARKKIEQKGIDSTHSEVSC